MPERRSLMLFPICDVVRFVKFSPFGKKDYTNRGERKRKLTQIIVRSRFGTSVRLGIPVPLLLDFGQCQSFHQLQLNQRITEKYWVGRPLVLKVL